MNTSARTRSGALVVLVALMALVGAACVPVQPLGQNHPTSDWYPRGNLDAVSGGSGVVRVTGWAAESPRFDTYGNVTLPGPSKVVMVVNGDWVSQIFVADVPRPDVGDTFRFWEAFVGWYGELERPGDTYGFDVTLPVAAGSTDVCVGVINTMFGDWGDHVLLGCDSAVVT